MTPQRPKSRPSRLRRASTLPTASNSTAGVRPLRVPDGRAYARPVERGRVSARARRASGGMTRPSSRHSMTTTPCDSVNHCTCQQLTMSAADACDSRRPRPWAWSAVDARIDCERTQLTMPMVTIVNRLAAAAGDPPPGPSGRPRPPRSRGPGLWGGTDTVSTSHSRKIFSQQLSDVSC